MPRVNVPEYKTFIDFPDGTPPEEMQSVLASNFPPKHGVVDAFKGAAANVAAGVNEASAGFLNTLDKGARRISAITGLPMGTGFKPGADTATQGAEYWRRKAVESGVDPSGVPGKIYTGLGSAPLSIAEFTAGPGFAAVKGAAEDGLTGAVTEGVKRSAIGKVFKGLEKANLSPVQRSGAMAGTMAAQTAAEGGSLEDVVAAGATGLALSMPGESGPRSVVRQRMQSAGAQPEVAAELSGRFDPAVQPAGMGNINTNNVDTVYSADQQPRGAVLNSEQMPPTESFRPAVNGPVLDAENASRISPYDATGPSPGLSIEVARLKQEHPFWSDAEYLQEAQRSVLTQNPETLPAATDMSTVRPTPPQAVRQSEDSPAWRRGAPIGDQEMGQRFGTSDRIVDPADVTAPGGMLLNPEVLPARTDADRYAAPPAPAERPAEQAPSRTVEPQSMENFNHDSLPTAAVTAKDSLVLQDAAPDLKIAVVGTPAEIKAIGPQPGKTVWRDGDKAYLIDNQAALKKYGSLTETKRALKAGDPEALGYPERPAGEPLQTAAVTKTGEVLTEPEAIKRAATAGDVAYAAEGRPEDLATKIEPVSEALAPADNLPANSIVTQINGLDGRPLGYEVTPHDGTPKGMHDAALKNARAMNNYERASNNETIHLVTGPNGEPTHRINARFGDLEPLDIAPAGRGGGGALGKEKEVLNGQVDLHAGVHLPTLVKQAKDLWKHYTEKLDPTAPAGSVKAEFDKNRKANEKFGEEPAVNKMKRALIDSSANVQEALMRQGSLGEHIRRMFDAISGASAKALLIIEQQRAALSGMSLREQQAMGDLVAIDRDLSIADYRYKVPTSDPKELYRYIFGKTPQELRAARQTFQADYKLTDAEMARVENATRQYFDSWKKLTQRMLDAGLIDATQKKALDAHDYSPKQFLEKIDPDSQAFSSLGGGRVTVPDSGIKRLKEGSDTYFRNNPMRLLSEATARIETRIARNEANQALATLPAGNGISEVVKPGTPAPAGYEAITYMENGKPQTIHMKSEYAKEWRQNDPLINSELVSWLQWLTGAKLVRAGATGYNPAFLVTNVPRDLVTIWMQSEKKGYSPHAPIAAVEIATDLVKVAGDAWSRKGRYVDYVKQGGGRELLTHEGALSSRRENLAPAVAKVQKVLSYVNEFSEVVTRLAYRERMIKNGMDPASASKAAGEYVDFSRGGSVAKAVDRMGIPYLNAAIQGTRSLARSAGRDPGAFAYKTAQLMVGAAGVYALNQITNPEGWANVSDREKADNFILMLPKAFEYTDKDGTTVSPYLKISKEQSTRPFTTVAELFTHWADGGKPTKQQLEMALGSAVPISIDKMPPAAAAFWTYALNADTYRKEPVWKGKQEIEPYAEYTNNTNPIYTAIGRTTATLDDKGVMRGGASPERLKASVEKIITPSNAYLQLAGNALTDLYEKMNPSDKVEFAKGNYEKLRSIPGVSRLLGGAKDTEQFREGIREARTGTATQQFEVNKTLDAMVLRYVKTGQTDADLYDKIVSYVDKQSGEARSRLEHRIEGLMETANLPDRGWWMAVRALQPEDRAEQFKARYNTVSPEEQRRMMEIADGLTGFVSDRFIDKWEEK